MTVEASVKNNCIEKLNIICGKNCREQLVGVVIPNRISAEKIAAASEKNGENTIIKVRLNKGESYEYHN